MNTIYSQTGKEILDLLEKADKFQDWLYEEIKPYLKGDILEIGSGKGSYSKKIIRDFPHNNIIMSDIDKKLTKKLQKRFADQESLSCINLDVACAQDFKQIKKNVRSVLAVNVLEHIENDVQAMKNVYQVLCKGGNFVILVPAHKWLFNSIDQTVGHYRRYTYEELEEKIKLTGFSISKIFSFNCFSILGWFITGNLLKKNGIDAKSLNAFNKLVPFMKLFENRILRKKIGISIIAVLKK